MKVLEKPKQFWESAKLEDSQQLISKYSKVIILNRALFCTPRERKYSAVPRDVLVLIFGSLLLVKARDNVKHLQQLFMIVSNKEFSSVQFSSVAQSCPTLSNLTDCSTPGFPVHHQLPELAQTHVHWVGDAIQPSHPLIPFSSCLQSFPASGFFLMNLPPAPDINATPSGSRFCSIICLVHKLII